MKTGLIIHGHFYQPPRENPWTESVDKEDSAYPFHDWNERIHAECYRANAYARIVDGYGRVERVVNNYTNLSFNFGPTLMNWLERHAPATYNQIIAADKESVKKRNGHGNAIAQGYNHAILPLCNERDRRTQIRWGLADFRHRFGRDAESLWLPETACNDETLGALIDEGLKYVILSPYQAERVRPLNSDEWRGVGSGEIDPSVPYKYYHRDGSGRSIAIFFYDGPIARSIAFEGALSSSQALLDRFQGAARGEGHVVNIATDGESYGHHFRTGERCLAYALEVEAESRGFWVTNYGEFLERYPPTMEVEIKTGPNGEGTAWSCCHGVGRWSRDCGCHCGACDGWNQSWRAPLRAALDLIRDSAAELFATTEKELFIDPWAARDEYIELINEQSSREEFLYKHAGRILTSKERERALTYLEMQRNALLMYTSCGWFFADISGIETVQDLKYAGRVLDLMEELELPSPRERFLEILSEARSNIPEMGNGADVFQRFVEGCRVLPHQVAAHLAISSLLEQTADKELKDSMARYIYRRINYRREEHGRLTLATGRLVMEDINTGKVHDYACAAMHFGGVDFYCALKPFTNEESFNRATDALWSKFRTSSLSSILHSIEDEFGPEEYGLEHILPEGRHRISELVLGDMIEHFATEYGALYKENRRRIEMLKEAGFELPKELRLAAEFTLGKLFEEEIRKQQHSRDPEAYRRAIEIASEVTRYGYQIDRSSSAMIFREMIANAVRSAVNTSFSEDVQAAIQLITLTRELGIDGTVDDAQEIIYQAIQEGLQLSEGMRKLALMLGISPNILIQERALPQKDFSPALIAIPQAETNLKLLVTTAG
jgi:alpha-amylase/alpha-mannosidase (GH57 family)